MMTKARLQKVYKLWRSRRVRKILYTAAKASLSQDMHQRASAMLQTFLVCVPVCKIHIFEVNIAACCTLSTQANSEH